MKSIVANYLVQLSETIGQPRIFHFAFAAAAACTWLHPATAAGIIYSSQAVPGAVVIGSPSPSASPCTDTDFGAVQIRIGLHATLAACFRDVDLKGKLATAFVTVPREFENRVLTGAEFARFRDEVKRTEDQYRRRAGDNSTERLKSLGMRPIPLGVFDNTIERIGYAYAYAIDERQPDGQVLPQTMMRTESFLHVNGHVILLMIIAPVDDGKGASTTFDLSEKWANSIITASIPKAKPLTSAAR